MEWASYLISFFNPYEYEPLSSIYRNQLRLEQENIIERMERGKILVDLEIERVKKLNNFQKNYKINKEILDEQIKKLKTVKKF